MLLAIDTSTRYAGVALSEKGQVFSSCSWRSSVNHTAELMPAVSQLMKAGGLSVNDLDGIVVALGPGGFSALRVGMSVAKGLCLASGKPLVGIGTLDAEAHSYLQSGFPVCALLDAGRNELSSAYFGPNGRNLREDLICPPSELLQDISQTTIFCGEGVVAHAGMIKETLGTLAIIPGHSPATRLWALAELGQQRLTAGEGDELAGLQPYYLRMPTIGGPKRRDRVKQQS